MYYYTYDISTAILDLDPDLCENLLFFVTLSILHIQTCVIHLKKAVFKGFISFYLPPVVEKRRKVLFWGPSPYPQSPPSPRIFCFISWLLLKLAFLKLDMCNIYKNNIAKMFLDFFKI